MAMLKILIPLFPLALIAQQATPPPMPPRPMPTAPNPAAEAEPKAGDVIATLGKRTIRYADFAGWLKVMAGPRAEMVLKNPASRNQAMKQYLDSQVLSAKARQQKIQDTPAYKDTLAAYSQQILVKVLMDEERKGSEGQKLKEQAENPSDAEVLAYFQANSDRYATPEKFTARHILVGLKGAQGVGDKGLTDEEAKAKIAKIQAELKAGKTFEDAAKEYSDDPGSKANGGLYKDITFGRFAKEFEAAVRTQEIGKVGEPVKTTFGYHLILVESRTPKQAAEFDKIKDTVKKQMAPERREKLTKAYLDQVKKEVGFKEGPAADAAPKAAPKAKAAPAPKP
jgi:parvulin-like peptidyl-prolyl isomerase